jgi:hypothetical protein
MPSLNTFAPHKGGSFDFNLFFSKFVATSFMHFNLFGFFENNIGAMKYITRHFDKFKYPLLLFSFAWLETTFCVVVEWISIIMLFSSVTVKDVLGNFVSLTVLINMN